MSDNPQSYVSRPDEDDTAYVRGIEKELARLRRVEEAARDACEHWQPSEFWKRAAKAGSFGGDMNRLKDALESTERRPESWPARSAARRMAVAQCEGCLTPYDCDVTHPAPCRTTPDALLRRVHERVHTVRIYAHAEWFDKDGDEHPGAVEVSWDHYKGDADWTERKASAPTLAAALQAVLDAEEVPR